MKIGVFKILRVDSQNYIKQILVGYDCSVRPRKPIYKYITIKK